MFRLIWQLKLFEPLWTLQSSLHMCDKIYTLKLFMTLIFYFYHMTYGNLIVRNFIFLPLYFRKDSRIEMIIFKIQLGNFFFISQKRRLTVNVARVKIILERLISPLIVYESKFPALFSVWNRWEKIAGNFKTRKKSWSRKFFPCKGLKNNSLFNNKVIFSF